LETKNLGTVADIDGNLAQIALPNRYYNSKVVNTAVLSGKPVPGSSFLAPASLKYAHHYPALAELLQLRDIESLSQP